MKNGKLIKLDDIELFENLKNTVILFMSPNDLSTLENKVIDMYNKNEE